MSAVLGGRYALERRIGEGGMAEVFLAYDLARSNTPVVVKRCRAHLAKQPQFASLFLREARLASLIHHPNVVELEATGEDEGQPYLVMEYLEGLTVRDAFVRAQSEGAGGAGGAEGRIPQDIVGLILLGAARGLAAAHSAVDAEGAPVGLVHRDVSPHNLFLTVDGVVKVLDFGIAKGAQDVTVTRAGHVQGKASYLAPEQLMLNSPVDARADLFALGVVAWELFAGGRLFKRATDTETIIAIRALQVLRPATFRSDLDGAYDELVMRLLARHPERRPQSAGEVAQALEGILARRAPALGSGTLATYLERVRRIVVPASDLSLPPPPMEPMEPNERGGDAARQHAITEVFGAEPEDSTHTFGPPVRGAWATPMPMKSPLVAAPPAWAIAGMRAADATDGYAQIVTEDAPMAAHRAIGAPIHTPAPLRIAPRLAPVLPHAWRLRWRWRSQTVVIGAVLLGALLSGAAIAFAITAWVRG